MPLEREAEDGAHPTGEFTLFGPVTMHAFPAHGVVLLGDVHTPLPAHRLPPTPW